MAIQPQQMMGYDRAITVFSPQGRLYQVEYAREAVKKGTISLGIVYSDGVLLGADKNVVERLMVSDAVEKLYQVDSHIGAATSGLVADGRQLINRARIMSQSHKITYDEDVSVARLTRDMCEYIQMHTQLAGTRPFGTALLIGGFNDHPKLFETDPSGSFWEYKATAIGENSDQVRSLFAKKYKDDLSLEDAISLALEGIYSVTKERFNEKSIDFAYIDSKREYKKVSPEEIKGQIEEIKKAKPKGGKK